MTFQTTRKAHHSNRPPPRAMHALREHGQSVWLDDLRREMTRSGELAAMIANGLRGMTSNPTIFEKLIRIVGEKRRSLTSNARAGAHRSPSNFARGEGESVAVGRSRKAGTRDHTDQPER